MTPSETDDRQESLRGRVEVIHYSSPRFSAGRLRTSAGESVAFAGSLMVREEDPVVLHGAWERHPRWGRQFKVAHFEFDQRMGHEGLARYLANHPAIKGIGPAKAKRIAEAFGDDFDRVIDQEPERVASVARLPPASVAALRDVVASTQEHQREQHLARVVWPYPPPDHVGHGAARQRRRRRAQD